MSSLTPLIAATWGFCGAVPYSGTRLITALWSNAEVTPVARKLAIGQFVVAMFTGPAFAAAAAPWLVTHARGANLASVACFVGLFANVAWPIITDKQNALKLMGEFGRWLSKASKGGEDSDEP